MATDAELAKKKESIDGLRAKIKAAQAAEVRKVDDTSNDVKMAVLDKEEARLKAELETIEADKKNKADAKEVIEAAVAGPVTATPGTAPADAPKDKE